MTEGKIIIANWKMNCDLNESIQLAQRLRARVESADVDERTEIVVCPSFDALATVCELLEGSRIRVGAQDIFWQEKGAYTGEVSGSMLATAGASLVIVGHSERRKYLHEDDAMVNLKMKAALAQNLTPVICVGETYEERSAGHTDLVLMRQVLEGLKGIPLQHGQQIIVAYEPVWVIGTGQAIDPSQAQHASEVIEQSLIDLYTPDIIAHQTRIIYGGSVDDANISRYVSLGTMRGALVGTASLNVEKFISLLQNIHYA